MRKKIIVFGVVIFIVALGIYQAFLKEEKPAFNLYEVSRGDVSQQVIETGQVKKGEKINLSFENAGRIEKIYVKTGETAKAEDLLAKLYTGDLEIRLKEAKSALTVYQVKLDKLLAGASQEEIQKAKTAISNAETSLDSAKQNLKNVQAQAEENLNQALENALNVLDDVYLKADNAKNKSSLIQRTYFNVSDQEGVSVKENQSEINTAVSRIKTYLEQARGGLAEQNISSALSQTKESLSVISDSLAVIREICESPNYRETVSSTDKSALDTQRSNIVTALTNVNNAQQTISSVKLTNQTSINTAEAEVSTVEGALQTARDELALITAPPREEDINLYQAQTDQAQAQLQSLENQIEQSYLRAPIAGQILEIHKKVGETVQPMLQDPVITLLPEALFGVEVDIYEEDIVKVKVGQLVAITLVALPEQVFEGKVVEISPAEKIVEGVVYYEVDIVFEEMPEALKPGMTADVEIQTAFRENVIFIPEEAIEEDNGKTVVKVFENGNIEEREIETGVGGKDMTEVVSGLKEGDKVIIP